MFPCWHQLKMKMHVFFCLSSIQHRAAQRRRWERVWQCEVRQGLCLKCQQSWSQAALLHCDPVTSWCRCSCLMIKLQYRWSQRVGDGGTDSGRISPLPQLMVSVMHIHCFLTNEQRRRNLAASCCSCVSVWTRIFTKINQNIWRPCSLASM